MFTILSITAAPTAKVDVLNLAVEGKQVVAKSTLSLMDIFIQADGIVQAVILLLLLFSVISWATIIDRSFYFMKLNKLHKNFEKYFWTEKSLDVLLRQVIQRQEKHSMALVFIAAMQEIAASTKGASETYTTLLERISHAMRVSINRSAEDLERRIGLLATIANSAPFIGLFGTVWGIMNSFQAIAMNKSASLAVVAPGIAEALFATAVGLLVAIPAAIFYNKLSQDFNKLNGKIENFAIELSTLLLRNR